MKSMDSKEYDIKVQEVNILHISDLHFGCGGERVELFNNQRKRLICSLVQKLCDYYDDFGSWKPDIVVVSGDIAYRGFAEEYEIYINDFYKVIKSGFGIEDDCIIVCPGNHDVIRKNKIVGRTATGAPMYYPRPSDIKINANIGDELNELRQYNEEHIDRKQICNNINRPRARHFRDYIRACCNNAPQDIVRLHIPQKWPWVHFAVLNSAWDCQDDHDEGKLRIGLDFLDEIINNSDAKGINDTIICAVFHHPHMEIDINNGKGGRKICNWLARSEQYPTETGGDCFVNRLNDSVKCIMNGHVHEQKKPVYLGKVNRENGFWSVCGTLISNDTPLYHCRVIKIRRDGSLSYIDLSSSKGETCFDWDISSHYGSSHDEFKFVIDKIKQSKSNDPFLNRIMEIISSIVHESINELEFILPLFYNDYLSNETDNILRKKKWR